MIGGPILFVLLCYPFLDLRFLIEPSTQGDDAAPSPSFEPGWLHGEFDSVGSLGGVIYSASDGQEPEVRADAALAFGPERQEQRENESYKRRRKRSAPVLDTGFKVVTRRLLADTDGHVRLELQFSKGDADRAIEKELEGLLATQVYVVRESRTELISAGVPVTRLYLKESAKTADPAARLLTDRLVREGEGSPFIVVVHAGRPDPAAEGTPLDGVPPAGFYAVSCRLMALAGRTVGVWQLWTDNSPRQWLSQVRALCRIICYLSEVTQLSLLQQDSQALAPRVLATERVDRFFRVRTGLLQRPQLGVWPAPEVHALAARHVNVAIDKNIHSRANLTGFLRRDVAGELAGTIDRIRRDMDDKPMLKIEDRMRIVELLADQSLEDDEYFSRLIRQADLPQPFKQQRQRGWSSNARDDALKLVAWALAKGTNPKDPRYTTLASILLPELPVLGLEDAATVVATVSAYRLVHDAAELAELQGRYLCPSEVPVTEAGQQLGPDFDWQGPRAEELQGWLRPPPPDFLDVGFLRRAIRRATSVCLVTVGATRETGTGVLIHPEYVLTNRHVVAKVMEGAAATRDAASIQLSFGSFSLEEDKAIVVTLDADTPIVASSPEHELDFALLKVSPVLSKATQIQPAEIAPGAPAVRASLTMLQHPYGESMKLAFSKDAVTFVDATTGQLQYVTRAARGSSGAPCFNDEWQLIGIHRSERSLPFGTIREGKLIGPILDRIKPYMA